MVDANLRKEGKADDRQIKPGPLSFAAWMRAQTRGETALGGISRGSGKER